MANIEIFGTLVRNDNNTNKDKIVQGNQVDGGYFVCETLPAEGIWKEGQLCYCTADSNFYQYKQNKWVVSIELSKYADKIHTHAQEELYPKNISMSYQGAEIKLGEDNTVLIQPGYISVVDNTVANNTSGIVNNIVLDANNASYSINGSEIATEQYVDSMFIQNLKDYALKSEVPNIDNKADKEHTHEQEELHPNSIYMNYGDAEIILGEYDENVIQPGFLRLAYNTDSVVLDANNASYMINGSEIATEAFVIDSINNIPSVDLKDYALKADIPTISDFISEIPSEYLTESELNAKGYLTEHQNLDHKADKVHYHSEYLTEHQSLSHLALKEHEHSQYLTEHQSLKGYATESYVDNAIKNIDVPDISNFISEIPAEYITESELDAKGYLTEHQDISGKADKEHEHPQYLTEHQSLKGYATETFVTTEITKAITNGEVDLTGYATEEYVDKAIATIPEVDLSEYAKIESIPDTSKFISEIPDEYVTENELNNKGYITTHQDLSHLALKEHEHTQYLTEHQSLENYVTKDYVDTIIGNMPQIDLSNYAKIEDLPDVSKFITEIPSEYITETKLADKGFLTEHQDLSHLAEKDHTHTNMVISPKTVYMSIEDALISLGESSETTITPGYIKLGTGVNNLTFDVNNSYYAINNSEIITDSLLGNILEDYATKTFVSEEVAKISSGGEINLDAYATKDYVNNLLGDQITYSYSEGTLTITSKK